MCLPAFLLCREESSGVVPRLRCLLPGLLCCCDCRIILGRRGLGELECFRDFAHVGRPLSQSGEFRRKELRFASGARCRILEPLEAEQSLDVALALIGACTWIERCDVLLLREHRALKDVPGEVELL